jgi:hypothetical protein
VSAPYWEALEVVPPAPTTPTAAAASVPPSDDPPAAVGPLSKPAQAHTTPPAVDAPPPAADTGPQQAAPISGPVAPPAVEAPPPTEEEAPPVEERPRWDRARRQLWLGTQLLRSYRRHAPAQFPVLDAFENAGWPSTIPIPAEVRGAKDAVDSLNDRLTRIRFQFGRSEEQSSISWRLTV